MMKTRRLNKHLAYLYREVIRDCASAPSLHRESTDSLIILMTLTVLEQSTQQVQRCLIVNIH